MSKVPVTVYAEITPNPNTMKFVANRLMSENSAPVEFTNKTSARGFSDLADDLFNFPFIESLFFSKNFVSITKSDSIEWDLVMMQLREFIRDFLSENKWAVQKSPASTEENKPTFKETSDGNIEPSEYDDAIKVLLDEFVKPAVESDGGAIDFKSFKDGTVTVVLRGACSGCPSSTVTLKNGIETLLKSKMDVIKEVVAEEV